MLKKSKSRRSKSKSRRSKSKSRRSKSKSRRNTTHSRSKTRSRSSSLNRGIAVPLLRSRRAFVFRPKKIVTNISHETAEIINDKVGDIEPAISEPLRQLVALYEAICNSVPVQDREDIIGTEVMAFLGEDMNYRNSRGVVMSLLMEDRLAGFLEMLAFSVSKDVGTQRANALLRRVREIFYL